MHRLAPAARARIKRACSKLALCVSAKPGEARWVARSTPAAAVHLASGGSASGSVDRLPRCAAHSHAPPPHRTVPDGDAGATETASAARAAPPHPAPATPALSRSSHTARHSLCRVVWRNPNSLPAASAVVASERIRAARQHGSAAHSSVRAPQRWLHALPSAPSSQPARPPSCTAHPVAHTSPETRATRVSLPHAAAHARASSCTRPRWRAG